MIAGPVCSGCREEGFLAFWKGNGANVVRIFPYSAAQMAANDQYKRLLVPSDATCAIPAPLPLFPRQGAHARM